MRGLSFAIFIDIDQLREDAVPASGDILVLDGGLQPRAFPFVLKTGLPIEPGIAIYRDTDLTVRLVLGYSEGEAYVRGCVLEARSGEAKDDSIVGE